MNTDREALKGPIHEALHDLDVRIPNLPGDCHCNLVAEVVLDALLPAATARAERAEADRDRAREERDKWLVRLNETITEVERAEAAIARVHRLAVGWQEPVLSFVSVYYPDAATALLAALDAQRPAEETS